MKVSYQVGWAAVLGLLLLTVASCIPRIAEPTAQPQPGGVAAPPTATIPRPSSTAQERPTIDPAPADRPTPNPTEMAVVEQDKALLYTRLDSEGTAIGSVLHEATPPLPAEAVGALEVVSFEQSDPFVSLSFYFFGSAENLNEGIDQLLTQAPQVLPASTKLGTGSNGLTFMLAYYYADGSRGDARQARHDMNKWGSQWAGEE